MKINNVVLSTFTTEEDILKFPFRDTRMKEPYVVKAIGGLDATDIISNFSGFGADSTPFFDMSLAKRTLIFRLSLNPTFRNARTHSDLRDELYRLIALDRSGKIVVNFCLNDDKLAFIVGNVTKVETNHFESGPEGQLTIQSQPGILRSSTWNELETESLGNEFFITDCISTAPHGMEINFRVKSESEEFLMYGADTTFQIKRAVGRYERAFMENDVIRVSSEGNNLYAQLVPTGAGTPVSIIENVQGFRGSQWPMVYPGKNRFQIISNAEVIGLRYREAFWGI